MYYRIKNWDDQFESSRTRDLKRMAWVPVPNRYDSDGYVTLLDHERGAAHYAAWIVLLGIAGKCDQRGTLLRDNGRPYDAVSLARISRIPVEIFEEALTRLVQEVGWLEAVGVEAESHEDIRCELHWPAVSSSTAPQEAADSMEPAPQAPAAEVEGAPQEGVTERKGRERKGIELNRIEMNGRWWGRLNNNSSRRCPTPREGQATTTPTWRDFLGQRGESCRSREGSSTREPDHGLPRVRASVQRSAPVGHPGRPPPPPVVGTSRERFFNAPIGNSYKTRHTFFYSPIFFLAANTGV